MKIEIITLNKQETLIAQSSGATQIELISHFEQGGLTPEIEIVKEVCESSTIPVYVMLRPHSKSFVYSDNDMEIILNSLNEIKKTKAHGIVFGSLNLEKEINQDQLKQIIKNKGDLKLTFHRAFDQSKNLLNSLKTLINYDVQTILTSGGPGKAEENIENLKMIIDYKNNHKKELDILIGSGVGANNIEKIFLETRNKSFHLGSSVRFENKIDGFIEKDKIFEVKKIFSKFI